jgi:hypothetical protein
VSRSTSSRSRAECLDRLGRIVAAPIEAPVHRGLDPGIGTKLVVAAGLLVMAGALWLLSTVQLSDGYGRVAATLALLGTGMGLTMAPATESIMGSLPLAKAGWARP